jgi:hypothetical protein
MLHRCCIQTRASTDIVENLRCIQLSKYTRPVFEVLGVFRIKWREIKLVVNKKWCSNNKKTQIKGNKPAKQR